MSELAGIHPKGGTAPATRRAAQRRVAYRQEKLAADSRLPPM